LAQLMITTTAKDSPRCADLYAKPWGPKVINNAYRGAGVIHEFGSVRCTLCKRPSAGSTHVFDKARSMIEAAQAPYIFVIDSHFYRGWEHEQRKEEIGLWGMEGPSQEALINMITHLARNGARHVFLATPSPFARFNRKDDIVNAAIVQRGIYHKVVKGMRCPNSTDARHRVLVSIVDYHKLICTDFNDLAIDQSHCDQAGPGFEKKMDDYIHPNFGPGGWYVTHQLLEVLYAGIARQGTQFATPFEGPVRCVNQLYPNDHLKSPNDLLDTTEVCV